VIGSVPVQVPFAAVSVLPSSVVPEIVGGAVLSGATADAAEPTRQRGCGDRERA
jgi:hypothetical protein